MLFGSDEVRLFSMSSGNTVSNFFSLIWQQKKIGFHTGFCEERYQQSLS